MSVRLFAGYFLALAACATIAFGASDPETSSPAASAAEFVPASFYSSHTGAFSVRHRRVVLKRSQMAQAH